MSYGKELNIIFNGKKDLYKFYSVKSFPNPYEIIISNDVCDYGKQSRMYRLLRRENDYVLKKVVQETVTKQYAEFNNKRLNMEFDGLRELYEFYKTNSFPNTLKIKESRHTINGKRMRKDKLITF